MTAANFPACLKFVLVEEGGNDNDPQDHGGRTSRGIIEREWLAYRARHPDKSLPQDVWRAPQADIEAIYHDQYWEPMCDKLPDGIDLSYFDLAVNAGPVRSTKCLQQALGVQADGHLGIETMHAAQIAEPLALIHKFATRRRAFYRALAQFPRYGHGWMSRAGRCEAKSVSMAHAAPTREIPTTAPMVEGPGGGVKVNEDMPGAVKPSTVSPEQGVAVSAGSGSLAGMIQTIQDQLTPYSYYIRFVQYALVGLAVVGLGLTIYAFWKRKKVQEALA